MNATDLSQALSTHAEAVCRHYLPNGKKAGRYWTCGNIQGQPGQSMHVRLGPPGTPGKWTDEATGEHGDLLDIIRAATNSPELRDAMVEARRFLALPPRPLAPLFAAHRRDPQTRNTTSAHHIWQRSTELQGTHAESYLRGRGISVSAQPALRFHPSLMYRDDAGLRRLPALVAAVIDNRGTFSGIHRTWLDPHLPRKASISIPRKALGSIHNNAVRFGTPGPGATLIAGEGLETVLSIVTALPGIPAAATLSAAHLGGFRPPPYINRLIIARDSDEDGGHAALRLSRHCTHQNIDAVVVEPTLGDFNDDLRELGPAAVTAAFAPHVNPA